MDHFDALVFVVHSARSHLQKFVTQDGRRACDYVSVQEGKKQLLFQLPVLLPCFRTQRDRNGAVDPFRKLQPVLGFHAHCNIADRLINPVLRFLLLFPLVNHMATTSTRNKVFIAKPGDCLAQSFALVNQVHLRPQIHKAIRCRRAG
ncbi:hypothetical protein D3C77_446100 [compost metagenome]